MKVNIFVLVLFSFFPCSLDWLLLTISLNHEISMEFACSAQPRSCYVIVIVMEMKMEKPGRPVAR